MTSRVYLRCALQVSLGLMALATAGLIRADEPELAATHEARAVAGLRTFTYKVIGALEIRADVYRPPHPGLRPVVVWFHPGALIMGSRAMLPGELRERLLRAGFVVVAVDHRLAPETKLPEILTDIDDAFRWVREVGRDHLGADPDRLAAMGASAGGYLALMAGARVQPRVRAVVSFYGYGDVSGPWYREPDSFYLGLPKVSREAAGQAVGGLEISEGPIARRNAFYVYCRQTGLWPTEVTGHDPVREPEKFRIWNPDDMISPSYPPTLLLHGDRDVDVPFAQAERTAQALARHRVEHRLIRLEGYNHAFDVFPTYPPQGPPTGVRDPKVAAAMDEAVGFLERLLPP